MTVRLCHHSVAGFPLREHLRRAPWIVVLGTIILVSCKSSKGERTDGAIVHLDAQPAGDAGPVGDAGSAGDAGFPGDAGSPGDAGPPRDAQVDVDATSDPQDFEARCSAPGVLLCDGFDDVAPTGSGVDASDHCSAPFAQLVAWANDDDPSNDCDAALGPRPWRGISTAGGIPAGDLPLPAPYASVRAFPHYDTLVKASGSGSMMLGLTTHIGTGSGSQTRNPEGDHASSMGMYRTNFSTSRTIQFGPGHPRSHFYVQFRWRGSHNLLYFEDPVPAWAAEQGVQPGDPRRFSSINCGGPPPCASTWSGSMWKLIWVQPADDPEWCESTGYPISAYGGCREPIRPCSTRQLIFPMNNQFHPNLISGFHNCGWYWGYQEGTSAGIDRQPGGDNTCIVSGDTIPGSCVQWVADQWMTLKFRYDIGPPQSHCGRDGSNCDGDPYPLEQPGSRVQAWVKIGDAAPIKFLDHRFYNRGPIVPAGLAPSDPRSGIESSGTAFRPTAWRSEGGGVFSAPVDFTPDYAGWQGQPLPRNPRPQFLGTPTAPESGHWDTIDGRVYVNLGGVNPATGDLVVGRRGNAEMYADVGYGRIDIYPQTWLKDWQNEHPALFMWVDELIVSEQDIAWPR